MNTFKIGYFVGSLSSNSVNRESCKAKAPIRVAPDDLEFSEIPIRDLPLCTARTTTQTTRPRHGRSKTPSTAQAILFVTPEYNRSIPGGLKNAIDWASRPWGQNAFDHVPTAVIGASPGQIGTALAQQSLRSVLASQRPPDDREAGGLHQVHGRGLPW